MTLSRQLPGKRRMPGEQEIAQLKKRVEEAKAARAAALARKEMAEKRLAEIEDQIRAMGIEPDGIEEEIARLEREIINKVRRAEELLRPFEELLAVSRS